MLTELADDPHMWDSLDKGKFAFYGSVFTIAMDAVIYPLEAIKTRIQVETKVRAVGAWRERWTGPRSFMRQRTAALQRQVFHNCAALFLAAVSSVCPQSKATLVEAVWRTLRTTFKADGVRGFYRGFSMFTFGGLPSQG